MDGLRSQEHTMLLDHFQPPLKSTRPWTGFHSRWAGNLAAAINRVLPEGWVAAPTVHWDIEVDVATFEEVGASLAAIPGQSNLPDSLPAPQRTIDFSRSTDVVECRVYRDLGELMLAGAVEFISPANKASPENREAFVSKCDAYLRDAVGLVLVDVVTSRAGNLHNELLLKFDEPADLDAKLYAAAYRPFLRDGTPALSIWYRPLEIGVELPAMPLCLKEGPVVELPLSETYRQTCADLRIAVT
jgi:hypothetical protein